ncbi:MAG: hypothetical protein IJ391_03835 [Clostridia bacterium]|nr:hypothetical protein [Clostridia bacterium]
MICKSKLIEITLSLLLICAATIILTSCQQNNTTVSEDSTVPTVSFDTTDIEVSTAIAEWTPPTEDEWNKLGFDGLVSQYDAICALLNSDAEEFARICGVDASVYDSINSLKIGSYRLLSENIPADDDPTVTRTYPVLEIEVLASNSTFFTPGTHKIVFDEGLYLLFTSLDDFKWYKNYSGETISLAVSYIDTLGSDRDFSSLEAEGRRQFGLSEFIVARLHALSGNYDARSEQEIRDYAKKYLGVDGDTLELEKSLYKSENGYNLIGRGKSTPVRTVLSEEIRDGITVLTVQFWADFSKTVPSRKVEFHMEMLDGEYLPIKAVVLEDSEFGSAYYST